MTAAKIRKRGASLLGYGLLVGLISVTALGAISTSGSSTADLFANVADTLDGGSGSATTTASTTPTPVATSCLDHFNAGASTDGTYSIDADGGGGDAPFDVTCDMNTDGGGWTLFVTADAVPAGSGSSPPIGYNALLVDQLGITDGGVQIAAKPAGTTARMELLGTDTFGGGDFALNMLDLTTTGAWDAQNGAAFNQLGFTDVIASATSNASVSGTSILNFSATSTGYVHGGTGSDSLLQIAQNGVNNSLTLGNQLFTADGSTTCTVSSRDTMYWIFFQTGPGGFNCKNTMEGGRISGCNNNCGTGIQFTQLRIWYR